MFANFYTFCKFHIQILSSVQSLCYLFYSLDFEWRLIDQLLQPPPNAEAGAGPHLHPVDHRLPQPPLLIRRGRVVLAAPSNSSPNRRHLTHHSKWGQQLGQLLGTSSSHCGL